MKNIQFEMLSNLMVLGIEKQDYCSLKFSWIEENISYEFCMRKRDYIRIIEYLFSRTYRTDRKIVTVRPTSSYILNNTVLETYDRPMITLRDTSIKLDADFVKDISRKITLDKERLKQNASKFNDIIKEYERTKISKMIKCPLNNCIFNKHGYCNSKKV